MTYKPAGITANRQTREVIVTWNDDHKSIYSFSLLRHACPCAECRGGHTQMSSEPNPVMFYLPDADTEETSLMSIEAVGTYAFSILWGDGHNYGIYNWGYLRGLCPCKECRQEGQDE